MKNQTSFRLKQASACASFITAHTSNGFVSIVARPLKDSRLEKVLYQFLLCLRLAMSQKIVG